MSRPIKLTLEQRMALRVAFRDVVKGKIVRFYRDKGKELGVSFMTIKRVVLG